MANVDAPPLLAARGTTGLFLVKGSKGFKEHSDHFSELTSSSRCMKFSKDGRLFAWCNSTNLQVINVTDGHLVFQAPKARTSTLSFSPTGSYLSVWEPYFTLPDKSTPSNNLEIYRLSDGSTAKGFIQKRLSGWEPQWSEDEALCCRSVTNEIHFFENGNFDNFSNKLHIQGVVDFSLSPGPAPYKVAVFVLGKKAQPSFVRLFQYPKFENGQALANKSFFKADKVDMFWNKKGSALLILTSTEVDTTGASYYGEQSLHFLSTSGESSMVPFDKRGPVYAVDWSSNSKDFCVVYGYMPAKAKMYNLKCEPTFDFGTGPRNLCYFNSHGTILTLAGFGNLRGVLEFWNVKEKKVISKLQAPDTTFFEWAPDGIHFVTATTSPRLKVDNGYIVWHYTGKKLMSSSVPEKHELHEVSWQNVLDGVYKEVPLVAKPVNALPKAEVYRPPSARASGVKSMKLHEDEPPENQREKDLSGTALKNKKKREAKAKAKQEVQPQQQVVQESTGSEMTCNDKKIKALRKKIRQIEDLKEKKKQGKPLEANQLEKLKIEHELIKELRELELDS